MDAVCTYIHINLHKYMRCMCTYIHTVGPASPPRTHAALRRALVPAQHLIHKLQAKAAVDEATDEDGRHSHLLSPLTRVYLSDVLDHVDTVRRGGGRGDLFISILCVGWLSG